MNYDYARKILIICSVVLSVIILKVFKIKNIKDKISDKVNLIVIRIIILINTIVYVTPIEWLFVRFQSVEEICS